MSKFTDSGVLINRNSTSDFKKIKPVLNNWIATVLKFEKIGGDACWWYNERANIGILAAAAWSTKGWVALEEYGTHKKGEDGGDKYGRCDLWFSNKSRSFAMEAKHAWQPIGGGDGVSYANQSIKAAWADAGKMNKKEADIRVAGCFIVPSLAPAQIKKGAKHIEETIQEWLGDLKDAVNWDALAYVFSGAHESKRKRLFPGVVLILQERKRNIRTSATK